MGFLRNLVKGKLRITCLGVDIGISWRKSSGSWKEVAKRRTLGGPNQFGEIGSGREKNKINPTYLA